MADFLDQTVSTQALQQTGNLSTGEVGQIGAQPPVVKSADVEFAAGDDLEQGLVAGIEEVESAIVAGLVVNGFTEAGQLADAPAGVVQRGEKLQVAPVGGCQDLT